MSSGQAVKGIPMPSRSVTRSQERARSAAARNTTVPSTACDSDGSCGDPEISEVEFDARYLQWDESPLGSLAILVRRPVVLDGHKQSILQKVTTSPPESELSSRIGRPYQARIPRCKQPLQSGRQSYHPSSDKIWDPVLADEAERRGEDINGFMDIACELTQKELLMELLHRSSYSVEMAKKELDRVVNFFGGVPTCKLQGRDISKFERFIRYYGKDFSAMSSKVKRSRGDCLIHYYKWKNNGNEEIYRRFVKRWRPEQCKICKSSNNLLICEACDHAYHGACLDPPVRANPSEDWICPSCIRPPHLDMRSSSGRVVDYPSMGSVFPSVVITVKRKQTIGMVERSKSKKAKPSPPSSTIGSSQLNNKSSPMVFPYSMSSWADKKARRAQKSCLKLNFPSKPMNNPSESNNPKSKEESYFTNANTVSLSTISVPMDRNTVRARKSSLIMNSTCLEEGKKNCEFRDAPNEDCTTEKIGYDKVDTGIENTASNGFNKAAACNTLNGNADTLASSFRLGPSSPKEGNHLREDSVSIRSIEGKVIPGIKKAGEQSKNCGDEIARVVSSSNSPDTSASDDMATLSDVATSSPFYVCPDSRTSWMQTVVRGLVSNHHLPYRLISNLVPDWIRLAMHKIENGKVKRERKIEDGRVKLEKKVVK